MKNAAQADKKPPITRTEYLMSALRRMPIGRQLIPTEAAIGWPAPYRANNAAYAILPVFGLAPAPSQGSWVVFAPHSAFTLHWRTSVVVEYVDYRFRSPWAGQDFSRPVGPSPSEAMKALDKEARGALLARLSVIYDALINTVADGAEIPEEMETDFREMLRVALEPGLWPFYRYISPVFYERFLRDG